jgi:uncharacterized membrane protein YfcA
VELLTLDPLTLAFALAVTVIAATVQGTVGFGFGIVSVPVLLLVDPRLRPRATALRAAALSAS